MDAFLSWLQIYILSWLTPPKTIEVIDIIQIIILSYCVYKVILWVKNTRANTLLKGIVFIIVFVGIANLLHMEVIVWLVENLSVAAFTAVVIIFQPELRNALEQVGHGSFVRSLMSLNRTGSEDQYFSDQTLTELVRAAFEMGETHTGALIVIERETRLEEFQKTGIEIDAHVSSQLLVNIFEHNTPLHDGAVLIRNDRVSAATCYLPLSDNMDLSKKLGTRHRAGLGISEVSDSFTIIVSEETGNVSYAVGGRLHTATQSRLREALLEVQSRFSERDRLLKRRAAKR